ncbi:MAG: B12-binding domain-containing radical SAM protein [Promethearchaeota archaeon]
MNQENLIKKDWRNIDFSFGLVYPNLYKIGMSSYALRLLYYTINSYENIACERIFLPEKVKYPAHLHSLDKIRSIENRVLLEDFDILGFSVQFENDFKNILWILENSSIPITSQNRQQTKIEKGKNYPLIIAGGPVVTSNPLPFSNFFDLFFIGDSEPNLGEFLDLFNTYNRKEINFQDLLKETSKINGIFVPSEKNIVKRSIQKDLNLAPIPDFQLISKPNDNSSVFERNYFVEINRGCPFQCKFCISSYHNLPFRNRSFDNIINWIKDGIRKNDFETISLIGSCVSAHPRFRDICKFIINYGKKFTIPSIRIDHLTSRILRILERGKIKTITIAPESGSERLRFELGKIIKNEKIYSVLKEIKDSKIKNVKLYLIVGLPGENNEDVKETINLMKNIIEIGFDKGALRLSVNPLIPKLNTPYQNKIDFLLKENIGKLKSIYQKLEKELKQYPPIKFKFKKISNIIKSARLQALISLGDLNTSFLLTNYYLYGANFGAIRKAEKLSRYDIDDYFEKIKDGYTPWKLN